MIARVAVRCRGGMPTVADGVGWRRGAGGGDGRHGTQIRITRIRIRLRGAGGLLELGHLDEALFF
jgi:hypothetical protein